MCHLVHKKQQDLMTRWWWAATYRVVSLGWDRHPEAFYPFVRAVPWGKKTCFHKPCIKILKNKENPYTEPLPIRQHVLVSESHKPNSRAQKDFSSPRTSLEDGSVEVHVCTSGTLTFVLDWQAQLSVHTQTHSSVKEISMSTELAMELAMAL